MNERVSFYDFPDAKGIAVSGDIHGEFNQLVYKCCVQYKMTDTLIITHTAPSFCELASKTGIANMAIRDEDLSAHVKYERQVMDKILNYLKTKSQPLHHWFYGHFHQSWHQEIDGVQYNMLDIMELRELR